MITKTYTFWGIFVRAAWLFVLIGFISLFFGTYQHDGLEAVISIIAYPAFGYWVYLSWEKQQQLKKRPEEILSLAEEQGYRHDKTSESVQLSQNLRELGERDADLSNQLVGSDWRYADYSYAIYRKSRHGEYKSETMHYSIVEFDLPRALPNMLFDSPKTHSRQFGHLFDNSQVHQLEGNFDQHFKTYFPKYYSIDALSIISPEVMGAMIDADECDIEISDNKLYLYRPLAPADEIPDMIKKGEIIKTKLLNNIITYRDERLDGNEGRKGVSKYGHRLRMNPYRSLPTLLAGVGLFTFGVTFGLDSMENLFNQATISGLLLIGVSIFSMQLIRRKNRQFDKRYQKLHGRESVEES